MNDKIANKRAPGHNRHILHRPMLALTMAVGLAGCGVNPVTGERELVLVPESQELSIGAEQYSPSRQAQGGDYTVDPELTRYVNSVGQRLAGVSDRKLPYEFTVLNNSTPNAWALPGGKIAINRGLLVELNSEAELAAVLGHEVVHAAAGHGRQRMQTGMLSQIGVMAVGIASQGTNYGREAVGAAQMALGLLNQRYGRDAERESDHFGMNYMSRTGYDPRAAVDLQKTFVRLNDGRKTDWLSGLFASHPPSEERVRNNIETAKNLPATGDMGRERYQQRIARLRRTKAAYDAFDEGRKVLAKGDSREALQLATKALSIEPREAHFHALLGDVYFSERRYREAHQNYDRALQRNDDFFYYHMQRGLVRQQLGDRRGAQGDLERSVKLLPTAPAMNALGKYALADGNRGQAKKLFQAAAGSKSPAGEEATYSLLRLDLPDNPNQYLKVRTGVDRRGFVALQVGNSTSVPVRDVVVKVQFRGSDGRIGEFDLAVRGVIAPGRSTSLSTKLGPVKDQSDLQRVRAAVVRAALAE